MILSSSSFEEGSFLNVHVSTSSCVDYYSRNNQYNNINGSSSELLLTLSSFVQVYYNNDNNNYYSCDNQNDNNINGSSSEFLSTLNVRQSLLREEQVHVLYLLQLNNVLREEQVLQEINNKLHHVLSMLPQVMLHNVLLALHLLRVEQVLRANQAINNMLQHVLYVLQQRSSLCDNRVLNTMIQQLLFVFRTEQVISQDVLNQDPVISTIQQVFLVLLLSSLILILPSISFEEGSVLDVHVSTL